MVLNFATLLQQSLEIYYETEASNLEGAGYSPSNIHISSQMGYIFMFRLQQLISLRSIGSIDKSYSQSMKFVEKSVWSNILCYY